MVPFSSYLTLNAVKFRSHSRSLEMAPFDRSRTSFYWRFIVTMALSCIVCEILVDKRDFFIHPGENGCEYCPLFFHSQDRSVAPCDICLSTYLLTSLLTRWCKSILQTVLRSLTGHACHRRTDRQTDRKTWTSDLNISDRTT